MSKPKGKEKKPQNYERLQKEYEEQKRQLLDATFALKKMQERSCFLSQQNLRLEKAREEQVMVLNQKIEELSIKNETNQKRLLTMRNDLTNAQVDNKKLINGISLLERTTADDRAERTKQYQDLKKTYTFEMAKYDNMLTDYKLYMGERDSRQKEINDLIEAREVQVANRIRQVADKERQKVQVTDKIRDEMGGKIREMRQNLLSLKKQELETTTRLTMLQNHQLTSELEYQSKQTQKIVFKNEELQSTIAKLRQQLEIHKQVEDQLAKRSHFSKGIIKKLHVRVQELEQEVENVKRSPKYSQQHQDQADSNKEICRKDIVIKNKEDKPAERSMVQAMDRQLQRSEKKYVELFTRYQNLKREKDEINLKWQTAQRAKNQIFNALLRAYDQIHSSFSKQEKTDQITLYLDTLKGKNVCEWNKEQLRSVILLLLQITQSNLSKTNLAIPVLKKILVFDSMSKQINLPKLSTDRQKKLNKSASQNRFQTEDVCVMAKNQLSKDKYSINIASKLVTSKLREWGKPVTSQSRGRLQRKYMLSTSYRN